MCVTSGRGQAGNAFLICDIGSCLPSSIATQAMNIVHHGTGELGYDGPLYDGFLHMTDDMLGPSPMHIKYR